MKSRRAFAPGPAAACGLLLVAIALGGCGARRIVSVATETTSIESRDGTQLTSHRLAPYPDGLDHRFIASGMVAYVQDVQPTPVLNVTPRMAEWIAVNMVATLVELRGVKPDGAVNETVYWIGSARDKRIEDHLAVIRHYLPKLREGRPLIVIGEGEGGAIAAAVAAREQRVTHLVVVGSGGGWTGEQELRHWLRERGAAAGVTSEAELDAALAMVRADPESLEMLGARAFRSWSARLDRTILEDLAELDIPVLAIHGDADQLIPVESARALRDGAMEMGKDLTYVEIQRADHHFRDAETGNSLYDAVEVAIADWLAQEEVISERTAKRLRRRLSDEE